MRNVPDFLVFDRNSSAEDQSRVLIPDRPSLLRRGARTKFQRNPSFKVAARPAVPPSPPLQQRQSEPVPPTYLDQLNQQQQPNNGPPLAEPMPMRRVSDDEVFNNSKKLGSQVESLAIPASSPSPPPLPATPTQPSSTTPPVNVEAKHTSKPSWSWSSLWSEPKKGSKTDLDIQPRHSVSSDTTTAHTTITSTTPTTSNPSQKKFGLSSLFSRKPSKEQATPPPPQKTNSMPAPKDFQLNRINQNRLPIHLERAIYRLSHMKLANPRRPLQEQVLISNFMFWYLSIVNAPASQHDPRKQLAKKAGGGGKPRNSSSSNNNSNSPKAGSPRNNGRTPSAGRPNSPTGGHASPPPANGRASPSHGRASSSPNGARRASPPHGGGRANNGRASPPLAKKDHADVMKRESTGFVVPENYLRPRRTTPPEDSDSSSDEEEEPSRAYHPHTPRQSPRPRSPQRRPQEDDVPLAMCRKK